MINTYSKLPDIVRTIIMDADIEKVWKAISTSDALAAWLMPNDFKPVIGHEFTFISKPKNDWDGIVHCEVKELQPPIKLGFTWGGNHMEQYVSFELKDLNGKTEFTLTHAGWSEDHRELREVMYDGWGYIIEGFRKKLGEENDGKLN